MTARLVVLVSGNGTNLQSILDGVRAGLLDASVVAVVSNNASAFALTRAAAHDVPSVVLPRAPSETRADYDHRLANVVAASAPDFVVLAGWMRILSMSFLRHFPRQVVNLHPALPGEFPGTNAIERAFDESRRSGLARTGVMVHLVPDEGVDDGPVIAVREVPIHAADSLDDLAARVHDVEHQLLVDTLAQLVTASNR